MSKPIVVKLQLPIGGYGGPDAPALVYDRTRNKIHQHMAVTDDIVSVMKGSPKKFFEVKVEGENLRIIKEVNDPGW